MFKSFSFSLCLLIIFSACSQTGKTPGSSEEKEAIQKLVQDLYEWNETQNSGDDFAPLENNDSIYEGLDLKLHEKRMEKLRESHFFTEEFLENYNKSALGIDKKLRNKSLEWYVGDLPPFGNDASPWCNCQDNPEQFWKKLSVHNLKLHDNSASFTWVSEWEKLRYLLKADKKDGSWKISYMEGFDPKLF